MIKDGEQWRLVHYEADILARASWDDVNVSGLSDLPLGDGIQRDTELRAGLDDQLLMADPDREAARAARSEDGAIDYAFAASHLLDVMPNPWRGHELIRRTFDALLEKHPREQVVGSYVFVLDELRKHLMRERDRLSRDVFETLLREETMRFIVVTDDLRFNRLPHEIRQPPELKQANRTDGSPYLHNLFDRTAEDDLNELENRVATYLDQQERLFFWYRNRARKDYYVQGWKPGRIYADFIVTLRPDEPGADDAFHQAFRHRDQGPPPPAGRRHGLQAVRLPHLLGARAQG